MTNGSTMPAHKVKLTRLSGCCISQRNIYGHNACKTATLSAQIAAQHNTPEHELPAENKSRMAPRRSNPAFYTFYKENLAFGIVKCIAQAHSIARTRDSDQA